MGGGGVRRRCRLRFIFNRSVELTYNLYLVPTLQFLCSFSMYVLVDFYSRHFVGTRPQTMVFAACPSPNDPLGNESVPRYFRGTFHLCMGTMPMLFT